MMAECGMNESRRPRPRDGPVRDPEKLMTAARSGRSRVFAPDLRRHDRRRSSPGTISASTSSMAGQATEEVSRADVSGEDISVTWADDDGLATTTVRAGRRWPAPVTAEEHGVELRLGRF